MLYLVSGINSLYLFVNLVLVPVPPSPTHLSLHTSLLPLLIHHSAHPELLLAFTPGLKPIPQFHIFLLDYLYGLLPAPFLLSYFSFSYFLFLCRALD